MANPTTKDITELTAHDIGKVITICRGVPDDEGQRPFVLRGVLKQINFFTSGQKVNAQVFILFDQSIDSETFDYTGDHGKVTVETPPVGPISWPPTS